MKRACKHNLLQFDGTLRPVARLERLGERGGGDGGGGGVQRCAGAERNERSKLLVVRPTVAHEICAVQQAGGSATQLCVGSAGRLLHAARRS